MRHAIRIREQRNAIAKRVRRMRQALVQRVINAKSAQQIAINKTSTAEHRIAVAMEKENANKAAAAAAAERERKAHAAEASAKAASANLSQTRAELVALNNKLERVRSEVGVEQQKVQLALQEAEDAEKRRTVAVAATTQTKADLDQLQSELSSERAALTAIKADRVALAAERETLKMDAERLRQEKTELEAEKAKLQSDRDDFIRRNAALFQSVRVLEEVLPSERYVRLEGGKVEIFASAEPQGEPSISDLQGAPDWVFMILRVRQKAMDIEKTLGAVEKRLQDRYLDLERMFPERSPEIQKARAQDKAIVDAAFAALSGQNQRGISG